MREQEDHNPERVISPFGLDDLDDAEIQLHEKAHFLLKKWMEICARDPTDDEPFADFLDVFQQQRVFENISGFFFIIIQLCVDYCCTQQKYSSGKETFSKNQNGRTSSQRVSMVYPAIDAVCKLIVFLVKFCESAGKEAPNTNNPNAGKVDLLNTFLTATCKVLEIHGNTPCNLKDSPGNGPRSVFDQRPYLRLFTNLLHRFNTPDPSLDSNNINVLLAFGMAFHSICPSRIPSFCFAWLELIPHRLFMSKLLISKDPKGSEMCERLLVDLCQFMQEYLSDRCLVDSIRLLYKGTLRVLIVLLHDFPDFLCEYYFSFCDVIAPSCIQMRNLILSAYPRNMRLPDPCTPNLKIDLLPETAQSPVIKSDYTRALGKYRKDIDSYLEKRGPASFLAKLAGFLILKDKNERKKVHTKYNIPLINSLVLYVGMRGLGPDKTPVNSLDNQSSMDIFNALINGLCPEGRYHLLNAIVNQLRYPNLHTQWFISVVLYLFSQTEELALKEQITRVLLERLVVHRPHPWGLLITFMELIKNHRYAFWKQPFTRCAPEIENVFESVALNYMSSPVKKNKNRSSQQQQSSHHQHQQLLSQTRQQHSPRSQPWPQYTSQNSNVAHSSSQSPSHPIQPSLIHQLIQSSHQQPQQSQQPRSQHHSQRSSHRRPQCPSQPQHPPYQPTQRAQFNKHSNKLNTTHFTHQ